MPHIRRSHAVGVSLAVLAFVHNTNPALAQTSQQGEETSLKPLIVYIWDYLSGGVTADTGTTNISDGQFRARTNGTGDANSFLRGLPNVQYQNDTEDDAGIDGQREINLRPTLYSISGGRTYENNFILDGMGINTVTGTEERYGDGELKSNENTPNADRVYGLHPQTVFVPSDFVESATVIDSNASAEYGSFMGGVVSYKLAAPRKDRWHFTTSADYQSDDMMHYRLGTADGLNPLDRAHPEFVKKKMSYSATGPLTDNISIIGQYSVQDAWTTKQKNYTLGSGTIKEKSKNEFYRLQANADTDYGDFVLEGAYTKYKQDFESAEWRDLELDTGSRSFIGKLENTYDAGSFSLGGISLENVHLKSRAKFSRSNTLNTSNSDVGYAFTQSEVLSRAVAWESSEMTDWCVTDPTRLTASTICREGGYGEKEQGQTQFGFSQNATGDVGAGTFNIGYEYTHTEVNRTRPRDYTYYTATTTIWDARSLGLAGFNCLSNEVCSAEQYASVKSIWKAFDIEATVNAANTYAEFDQTWEWLNVRAGIRADFDDYQKNLNLAPRIVATVTPVEAISLTGGYNRYYDGLSLAYAVRETQPRGQSYRRTHASDGSVDGWTMLAATGNYVNSAAGLDTPYVDEFTAGIRIRDSLTDGEWRFRFMNRQSRDQYATEDMGKNVYMLTNSGSGAYQSATAEYAKEWAVTGISNLESVSLTTSLTWSKERVSANSYFTDEDDLLDRIYYKGQSYTLGGFSVVTGNMDIPLRAQIAFDSTWMDGRLNLGLAMNYNFAYKGAADTDEDIIIDGINHDIWEDHSFKPVLTVDFGGSYTVAKKGDSSLAVNFKVDNVFDEIGNATASTSRPWIRGRSFWFGASATF